MPVSYELLLFAKEEGMAVITLNRPEVLNALSFQLGMELDQAIGEAEEDEEVGAIIITGAGDRAFSAGGDIHEQRKDAQERSQEDRRRRTEATARRNWHITSCTKPTIGAMNGLAYGGGARLASEMDIRVGCERTSFRFLAAAYGRINSTWTLPLQVGWPMAKELLFTGREVGAEEAYRIGLLNHLVPPSQLMEKAREIGRLIVKNRPTSVQGIKQLLMDHVGSGFREMHEREEESPPPS